MTVAQSRARAHLPKHALKVLDAMIGIWLRDSPKGRAILANLGGPLPEAIATIRGMVDAGLLVLKKGPDQPGGRFLLAIEPRYGAPPPQALPGLPGGEALS